MTAVFSLSTMATGAPGTSAWNSGHIVPMILLIPYRFQYIISIYPFRDFSQIGFCHLFYNHFCFRVFAIQESYHLLSCNPSMFFNKIKYYLMFFFMFAVVFLRSFSCGLFFRNVIILISSYFLRALTDSCGLLRSYKNNPDKIA